MRRFRAIANIDEKTVRSAEQDCGHRRFAKTDCSHCQNRADGPMDEMRGSGHAYKGVRPSQLHQLKTGVNRPLDRTTEVTGLADERR
jgi:hypothetical protein